MYNALKNENVNGILKKGFYFIGMSVFLIETVFKMDKVYCPKLLLKKANTLLKKIR